MRHLQWMLTGLRPKTAYDRHHSQSSIDFRACRMIGKMSLSVFLALIFSGYLPAQTQPVSQNPVAQLWARVSDLLMDPSKVGCFFREVLLTVSGSPATPCASWIFSGFSTIKHV